MKNKILIKFIFIIFFFSLPLVSSFEELDIESNNPFELKKIYVDKDNLNGPWDGSIDYPFNSISDGINSSLNGVTIYVFNGEYNENIKINKSIMLLGENQNLTIINGNYNEYIFSLNEDCILIKNFSIHNSGGFVSDSGIFINSNYNSIENCTIYKTKIGVYIYNSSRNYIKNCIFHNNGNGIYINTSNSIEISKCYFSHNSLGINIQKSSNINIKNSYATINGVGFFINASSFINISSCALYNNNDNQGGIFLVDSKELIVYNSIIRHNGFGIDIESSQKINISKNDVYLNTHTGVYIEKNSKFITVHKSNIFNNFRFGIYTINSNSTIKKNNFYNSLLGVYSEYSTCDLRYNWWGSKNGPALYEKEINDRLLSKKSIIKFYPWSYDEIDNNGADWEINFDLYFYFTNMSQFDKIEILDIDSDKDFAPDWWEKKWGYDPFFWDDHINLDPDEDGLNNIQECYTDIWNSNPFYRDIFLEIDWTKSIDINNSNKPSRNLISKMIYSFYKHNISLHVDDGCFGGGEEISQINNFSFSDLTDLYWIYFLKNNLSNPRKNIFHYCIVCDYGPASGFAFFGWNNLDSFLISAQTLKNNQPKYYSRDRLIVGGIIHELGHTLGLFVDDHGGNDNRIATWPFTIQWWKYLSYRSCMNYWYTYKIIDFSDGSNGINDYDDWNNIDFYFFKDSYFDWPKTN